MAKKTDQKAIEDHLKAKKVFQKVQGVLRRSNVHKLGLRLTGLNFGDGNDDAGYTCDRRTLVYRNGQYMNICIIWSDGKDHSNDPDVPDTPED